MMMGGGEGWLSIMITMMMMMRIKMEFSLSLFNYDPSKLPSIKIQASELGPETKKMNDTWDLEQNED